MVALRREMPRSSLGMTVGGHDGWDYDGNAPVVSAFAMR
jgi:hypothetical protein